MGAGSGRGRVVLMLLWCAREHCVAPNKHTHKLAYGPALTWCLAMILTITNKKSAQTFFIPPSNQIIPGPYL